MTVTLRGITWDHPRGYEPLVATARAYELANPGVQIRWEWRSLQAFADQPIADLAARYDLLVIDHPHVGTAAVSGCLVPLDTVADPATLDELKRQSVGRSHASYHYAGHQWAVAIDAAAQVAAYRPDFLAAPPTDWVDVVALARAGMVLWPIKPVDAISSFCTLAAHRGTPAVINEARLLDRQDGLAVLATMLALGEQVPPMCLTMNPIDALDELSTGDRYAYCPLLFGYTNYARDGFRPHLIHFTSIPALDGVDPSGSLLGGTGMAVSAASTAIEDAVAYALWVADAARQKGLYVHSGGQPAHAAAWDDAAANALCHGFFRDTRATLTGSWLRPRYHGYIAFQDRGGVAVNRYLAGGVDAATTIDALDEAFQASLRIRDSVQAVS